MRSPVAWFGGKARQLDNFIRLIPQHEKYVEVFGGGCPLLFAKKPADHEIYNDLDIGLVNFFRVLRNENQSKELERLCSLTPYAREEYMNALSWRDENDPVKKAHMWYIICRMSFSGIFESGFANSTRKVGSWFSVSSRFAMFQQRIKTVMIENHSWKKVMNSHDDPSTFFYLDPPYVHETRRGGKYEHEMTVKEHRRLVRRLLQLKGKALLSGYDNSLYKPLERAGWNRREWEVDCKTVLKNNNTGLKGKGAMKDQMRTEVVWFNYEVSKWKTNADITL